MTNYTKLNIKFYSLEKLYNIILNDKVKSLDIKNLGIMLAGEKLILSTVLYSDYNLIIHPSAIEVNKGSYKLNRKQVVLYFLDVIVERKQKGNTETTIRKYIASIISLLSWINKNDLNFPINILEAQSIFSKYVFYLRGRIREGSYSNTSAQTHYSASLKLLTSIFNDTDSVVNMGIKPIQAKLRKRLEKSLDKDIVYSATFYYQFFTQIADFIIQKKDYPFLLKLPSESFWVIPSKNWIKSKAKKEFTRTYDYNTGTIKSVQEIQKIYKYDEKTAYDYRNAFRYRLEDANWDVKNSKVRIALAQIALKAYFMHFLAITGMNDSTAATLKWNDDYNIEKEQHSFINIKYRANNKTVEFKIQKEFMPEFRQYVKLRAFLLGDNEFEYLFFYGNRNKARLGPAQRRGAYSAIINQYMVQNIDTNLPIISSKQNRLNKIHQIIKKDGIIAAAKIAQNLTTTIMTYYLGESEESTLEQFSEYFNILNKNIILKKSEGTDIAIGQCKDIDSPSSKVHTTSFNANCINQEGCLFCDKFGIHADEKDIRKLYSLEFLINECKYIAIDKNDFNMIYGKVLERIKNIIDELSKVKPHLQNKIDLVKNNVYVDENLTPYFEHKLNMLIKIGVIK